MKENYAMSKTTQAHVSKVLGRFEKRLRNIGKSRSNPELKRAYNEAANRLRKVTPSA